MKVLAAGLFFLWAAPCGAQDLSKPDKKPYPPLFVSIASGDLEATKPLVTAENLNAQLEPPRCQETPLTLAVLLGKLDIVKYLVEERKASLYTAFPGGTDTALPEAAVRDMQKPETQQAAAYLLPRYDFYADYLALMKAAPAYSAASFAWPGEKVRVLFVGENHGPAEYPAEIARLVESLPITHLATEFLGQKDQPVIEEYMAGTLSETDFLAKVTRANKAPAWRAAKKKGVRLIGLEKSPGYPDRETAMRSDLTGDRNKLWLVPLLDILKFDPKAKILVYCGRAHSNYHMKSKPISELVADEVGADAVFVAALAGGTPSGVAMGGPVTYDLPTYMAETAGRAGADFKAYAAGTSPSLKETLAVDVLIHLKHAPYLKVPAK